jgi:hypothetical protein
VNNLTTDGVLRIELFENHFPRKESEYHYGDMNIKQNTLKRMCRAVGRTMKQKNTQTTDCKVPEVMAVVLLN